MKLLHQLGDVVAQRYRIRDILGRGGVGITYKAIDLQNNQQVALKALSLRRMTDWKVLELFEREARILSQLNHPAIPRYLDYFSTDTEQDRCFYIVQQLAPGKSLADLVDQGWYLDADKVRLLAIQVLEILVYLHSFTPPIIHRDIKPQNIILNPLSKGIWGDLFLVDFGAVQNTYHNTLTGGSTVVGTYGYMAPEQFRGQAVLSTDLYGLGMTLLFLLTGKSPADLPQRQLKIDFLSQIHLCQDFADWLDRMIEPVIENRFLHAKEALAVLQGKQVLPPKKALKLRRPKATPITLTKLDNQLLINIPPVWLRSPASLLFAILPLVWTQLLVLIVWTILVEVSMESWWIFITILIFPLSCLILCLTGLLILVPLVRVLWSDTFGTQLAIAPNMFSLRRWCLGLWFKKTVPWTWDISPVKLNSINLPLLPKPITAIALRSNRRQCGFGLFLTHQEKEWLIGEITAFLEKVRQR